MKLFGDQVSGVRLQPKARAKTMKKRTVAIALGAMLFAVCASAEAQQPTKVYRIGLLSARSGLGINDEALQQGMRELGYVEGKNVFFERRFAEGKLDRLPALVAELVRLKVDIIIVSSTQDALAAKTVTKTIPIVFAIADDPVHSGLVVSLAQPNGNATGVTDFAGDLGARGWSYSKRRFQSSPESVFLYGARTVQAMPPRETKSNRRPGF